MKESEPIFWLVELDEGITVGVIWGAGVKTGWLCLIINNMIATITATTTIPVIRYEIISSLMSKIYASKIKKS